ncbi:MAG: hypothetical protein IJY44_06570 [Bacteroidaceae bacterium]|nr:hypothetical protein [Bacteroidaceae bacterium]
MKKAYVSPVCEVNSYEPSTFILANSVPGNSSRARTESDNGSYAVWGSLWE